MPQEKKRPVAVRVWELAEPLAQKLSLTLWDVQFAKEGAEWYLRIVIDKEDGVNIDDCVNMTHALDPVLDREDPISQEYVLEVVSPGFERKLTRPEHFAALLGAPVRVKLHKAVEGIGKLLEGELMSVSEDGTAFELQLDEETSVTIERKECSSVNLIEEL